MLRQDAKKELLLAIEESLCTEIEDNLEQRAKQLADANYDELTAEYMNSHAIKKFLARCQSRFPDLAPDIVAELVKKYLESQIDWAQPIKMEQDIITISQYLRKHFGLEAAVTLLENIHDAAFDLNDFMSKHIEAAKLQPASATPKPSIFDNSIKFQRIDQTIKRLRNFYLHAAIKREYYCTPALQQEPAYKNLQESLMWVDGQRLACVTGMKLVASNNIHPFKIAQEPAAQHATALQGARAHLENTIGMFVSEELLSMADWLTEQSVEEIVARLKSKDSFAMFMRALGNGTRAGFDTFLPLASLNDLHRLIDEYLAVSVHLAQSLPYERNVIRISQYVRQNYGIPTARKLLTEIEYANFDIDTLLKEPRNDMRMLIDGIHQFYIYANIKKQDSFFESDEPQAQKLFESEMWISLQRHYCLQGMALIASGQAYQAQKINFAETAPVAATPATPAAPVSAVAPASSVAAAATMENPAETKKPRLERTSSLQHLAPRAIFDWSQMQGGMSEEEAMAEALRQSQQEAREEAELATALERSRADQRPIEPAAKQARPAIDEQRDYYGRTPLMLSCAAGDLDAVKALLVSGADINATSKHGGLKPIHQAAKHPHVLEFLISQGASLLDRTANQQTALQMSELDNRFIEAARNGDLDSLTTLWQRFSIPVDCRNYYHNTALHAAAKAGQLAIVKFLIEVAGADIDTQGDRHNKALHYAAQNKHLEVMAYLIAKGASPTEINSNNQSAHALADVGELFTSAARTGNTQLLRYYLNELQVPVDVRNAYQKTALMVAAENGQLEVMRLLVESYHANIHMKGTHDNKAIHYAATRNQLAAMTYLISVGAAAAETNAQHNSALALANLGDLLVTAAQNDNRAEVARLLTELKVPVDMRNAFQKTALMVAAETGNIEMVRYLTENCGANLQLTGRQNFKAIHYAAQRGHEDIVLYFMQRGVSASEAAHQQQTALSLLNVNDKFLAAARNNDINTMQRYWRDFQVAATVVGPRNKPALIIACESGLLNVVRFLVEECHVAVDVKAGNMTALEIADHHHHAAVVEYLLQHGAAPLPPKMVPPAASPVLAAPRNELMPAREFAVLADALLILQGCQRAAKLREHEKDDADAPYWGTSAEEDERYRKNHVAAFELHESGLPENRFYAACTLLDKCMPALRCDAQGYDLRDNPLEVHFMAGTTRATITASHNLRVLQRQQRSMVRLADYPAPIALFPFEKWQQGVMNMLASCFTDWSMDVYQPHKLLKKIRREGNNDNMLMLATLYNLQEVCREFDKNFNLEIETSDRDMSQREFSISVAKASLEHAKKLLGYKTAFKTGMQVSIAAMLTASSPIMSRSEHRDDERGMQRSASMEFKP